MTIDAATTTLLDEMNARDPRAIYEMTLEEARAATGIFASMSGNGPEMARVVDGQIPVSGGEIPYRLIVPLVDPQGVIVLYHGGGWVIGYIEDYETLGRVLAERTGCAVVLVGYRLAPEYRFPTAIDDCYAALQWVDEHMETVAGARVPLIVAGESAGGNACAVVAQRSTTKNGPKIDLQILVYPVTDCDFETPSYCDPNNQLMLTKDAMIWFWNAYVPVSEARLHPDASPLRIADASGLPPTVILTAEYDVLRDEGELYAAKLLEAGVPVQHLRVAGQMHGFFTLVNVLPGSEAGIDFVAAAVRKILESRSKG